MGSGCIQVCVGGEGGRGREGSEYFWWSTISIGSDRDLVMMAHLKKARKPTQPRLKFDLEKLRDPDVACTFQATIGREICTTHWSEGWWHGHRYHDYHLQYSSDWCSQWGTWEGTSQEQALGHQRCSRPLLWERNLKKKRYEAGGAKEYREANKRIQKAVKKVKEDWIGIQCEEI